MIWHYWFPDINEEEETAKALCAPSVRQAAWEIAYKEACNRAQEARFFIRSEMGQLFHVTCWQEFRLDIQGPK